MLNSTIYQFRSQLALRKADFHMMRKFQQYKELETELMAMISRIEYLDYELIRLEDLHNMKKAEKRGKSTNEMHNN